MPSSFLCGICGVQMPHNGRKTCDDCKPLCIVCGEKVFGRGLQKVCAGCTGEWKWCKRCETAKPRSDFRLPNGRPMAYCYGCVLADGRARGRTQSSREWYFTYHLRRKFPITVEEARALADVRECAVCHARAADWAEARKMLHVDHDHATGRIRGVLCRRCNLALSALEGDKDWIVRLQSYMAA